MDPSKLDPAVASALTGIVLLVLGYVARLIERRKIAGDQAAERSKQLADKEHANTLAKLDLEAQRLVIEQEWLAESKKRTTGRATPTGLRHETVKKKLGQTFPGFDTGVIDERIKEHARTASVSVKNLAPSIMPTASESAMRMAAVRVPSNPPPTVSRPSGEHDTFGEVDLPRDEATLDISEDERTP